MMPRIKKILYLNNFKISGLKKHCLAGLALILLSLCAMPGCAVFTPTDPYEGISSRTPAVMSAEKLPSETQTVALPQSMDREITLAQALDLAVANNPGLAAASFDADAALAGSQAAQGALWPVISAQAGYARHLDDQRLVPAHTSGELGTYGNELFSGDLLVRAPLFMGGKRVNASRAADLMHQSATHDLARTREELVFNVSSVFYAILAQKSLIHSLEFSATTLEGHLKRINDMIDAQKAAMVDRLRTEVRLSSVKTALVRENNVLKIQYRLLATLMGIKAMGNEFRITGTLKPSIPATASSENLTQTALKNRPDYLSARKKLEAQARQVDIARAGHSPDIWLIGAYGGRWAAGSAEQPPGADDSEDVGSVGITVEIPLFEGGQTRARISEERAKLAAVQKRLQNQEFQIRLEVETAFANMTSASERVSATEKAVEQGKESLRIEQEKYELGRGAILDVLDAQSALLETETNYYQAMADVNVAIAQLRLATGESL